MSGAYYIFTIKNTCNKDTNYQINLESLNESPNSLKADYLKVALSSDTMDNLITKLGDNPTAVPMITGAYEAHNLYNGTIKANEAKEFTLREWIDYDVTKETGMNKTVTNKINVIARPDLEVEEKSEIKTSLVDYELKGQTTGIEMKNIENSIISVKNDENHPFSYNEETGEYTSTNEDRYSDSIIEFTLEKEGNVEICYDALLGDNSVAYFSVGDITFEEARETESKCINLDNIESNKKIRIYYSNYNSGELKFKIKLHSKLTTDDIPIKYCISNQNKCEPNLTTTIIDEKLNVSINENDQIVCTKINNEKTHCSDKLNQNLINAKSASELLSKLKKDNSRSGEITANFTSRTPITVYSKEDDDGTSYVFAGINPNNWVKLGSLYFRIIRFNGNGSMRLIYSGEETPQINGKGTQISTKVFNSYQDYEGVGLQYTKNQMHGNDINSTILGDKDSTDITTLYGWYNSKIKPNYESLLDTNAGFCSDRRATGDWESLDFRANKTYHQNEKYTPDLTCPENGDKLILPIGLITADEYALAGGGAKMSGYYNTKFWLFTGEEYWTMTPSYYYAGSQSQIYTISSILDTATWHSDEKGTRPVINLKSNTTFEGGTGTSENPYRVSTN